MAETLAEPVLLSIEGGVATLTLNRPGSMNALSREMMRALEAKVRKLANMPDLRAVIVTGAGRAFCAGGDLVEFGEALETDSRLLLEELAYNMDVLQLVEDLPVPVIGAANGAAVAGGLELLLCCDIILAAEGAKIGDGHARYGVVPAGGATVRLAERVPPSCAAQLFYTASLVDAVTLMRWGLVNEVVPAERLAPRAMEIAREITRQSPEVLRHVKVLTGSGTRGPERQARLRAELERFALHVEGSDLRQGLAAFRNKRQPDY